MTLTAAHADAAPNKWCPQACPAPVLLFKTSLNGDVLCAKPGKASNSPKIAITGPLEPNSAIKAVGMPATALLISNPSFSNASESSLELSVS